MQKSVDANDSELRDEYDFSSMTVLPRGRYAQERRAGENVVLLAPDVRQAFPTDEAVNEALRLVIEMTKLQDRYRHAPAGVGVRESPDVGEKD